MIMLLLERLPLTSYESVLLNLLRVQQGSFNKFALFDLIFSNKMGNVYDDIAEAVKTIYKDDVKVDNFVFKLHRSFTSLLCILFATILLVTEVSFQQIYEYFRQYYAASFYFRFILPLCYYFVHSSKLL